MLQRSPGPSQGASFAGTVRRPGAVLALAALGGLMTGCNSDEAMRAFRNAASSSLQTGVTAILTGLVDGAFAVFELGPDGQADEGEAGSSQTPSEGSSGSGGTQP